MAIFDVHEAEARLPYLIGPAEAGEEVVIARFGVPIARLVPHERARAPRRPGRWKGQVFIPPDFDALPDELTREFGGEGP